MDKVTRKLNADLRQTLSQIRAFDMPAHLAATRKPVLSPADGGPLTPQNITLAQIIAAHQLLAVSNGFYVLDMLRRDIGSPRDVAMCAKLAVHHAHVYRELSDWAARSPFARPNDPIADTDGAAS